MKRLGVHDKDQDQADTPAKHKAEQNPERCQQSAFHCQHAEDLAPCHADVTHHAEFFGTRQSLRRKAGRNAEQANDYCHTFQQIGYGKAAVKNIQA